MREAKITIDAEALSIVISAYSKMKEYHKVIELWHEHNHDEAFRNVTVYDAVITAYAQLNNSKAAENLLAKMIRTEPSIPIHTIGMILQPHHSDVEYAYKIFGMLKEANIKTRDTYLPILEAFCRHNHVEKAEEVMAVLKNARPDIPVRSRAYSIVIHMYRRLRKLEPALAHFSEFSKSRIPLDTVYVDMLVLCEHAQNPLLAEQIFEDFESMMTASEDMLVILISIFAKFENPQKAFCYFNRMLVAGYTPNHLTYTQLLSACSKVKDLGLLETIVDAMKADPCIDVMSYMMIITLYCKMDRADKAIEALEEAKAKGIADAKCYLPILRFSCQDRSALGEILWEDFLKSGFQSTPDHDQIMMVYYSQRNQVEKLEAIYNSLSDPIKIVPPPAYRVLLHLYSRRRNIQKALEIYKTMRTAGYFSALYPATSLTRLLREENQEQLLDQIYYDNLCYYLSLENPGSALKFWSIIRDRGTALDVSIYSRLLYILSRSQMAKEAIQVFHALEEAGLTPTIEIFRSIIPIFYQHNPEKAESLFRNMTELNLTPTLDIYQTMLNLYTKRGANKKVEEILANISKE